jgi:hypothetical protein
MAATLEQISKFLMNQDIEFFHDEVEEVIVTGFQTEQYSNEDLNKKLPMLIQLEEDGRFLKIFAPKCYMCEEEVHRPAVMQTLLMVSWKTKMIQFEFDASDGEIRAIIEFPLEDAELTEAQLMRAVKALVQIVDRFHPVIQHALDEGVIEFPPDTNPLDALQELFQQFEGMLEELGIDLEEIEEDIRSDSVPFQEVESDDDEYI